jgi:putative peptidoglycan lipid II flippase
LPLQHAGLALAIGLGACINASLLYYHLRQHNIFQPQPGWTIFLLKLLAALSVMGVTLYFAMGDTRAWLHYGLMKRLIYLSGLVGLGGVSYFATLLLLGFKPRDYIRRVTH